MYKKLKKLRVLRVLDMAMFVTLSKCDLPRDITSMTWIENNGTSPGTSTYGQPYDADFSVGFSLLYMPRSPGDVSRSPFSFLSFFLSSSYCARHEDRTRDTRSPRAIYLSSSFVTCVIPVISFFFLLSLSSTETRFSHIQRLVVSRVNPVTHL